MSSALEEQVGPEGGPKRIVVRLFDETLPLHEALVDARNDDGISGSDRIRALLDIWMSDPDDPDTPGWVHDLRAETRQRAERFAEKSAARQRHAQQPGRRRSA